MLIFPSWNNRSKYRNMCSNLYAEGNVNKYLDNNIHQNTLLWMEMNSTAYCRMKMGLQQIPWLLNVDECTMLKSHLRLKGNDVRIYLLTFSQLSNPLVTQLLRPKKRIWPHDWKSVSLTTELRIIHAGSKTIVPENSKAHCITLHKIHRQSKMRQIYCIHVWWNPH